MFTGPVPLDASSLDVTSTCAFPCREVPAKCGLKPALDSTVAVLSAVVDVPGAQSVTTRSATGAARI